MTEFERHKGLVPNDKAGNRLDQALADMFPDFSRTRLRAWIEAGLVEVDGQMWRPRDRLRGGENVVVHAMFEPVLEVAPEAMDLEIVFEDDDLIVIDKPAGLVVHPGAGNARGTLQNGLLHYDASLSNLPRAGIVHRLDKDTGGLMVIARSVRAHTHLVRAIAAREVTREYLAICRGAVISGGTIDAPIGRHPVDRIRMAVVERGRVARTHYKVKERFRSYTLVDVKLDTGRTHQIRVHMAHIAHPLVGDPIYGGRLAIPSGTPDVLRVALHGFRRQALHATRLELAHPVSGDRIQWHSEPGSDMKALLILLRTAG